ncbi:lipoprotein [Algoriphagus machipongonensis]|uniref:Lipoprotein n=2 Tax=Algoriphagus machipongonensis TaxID=388413 RepID=A3I158_9BACT|nr:lipoprotein [Algoriphagus machipongonensis]
MVLTLTVLVSSCISDESSMDQPLDPTTNVEKTEVYPEVFSLENLRMDPETLKMLANLRAATAKYHDIEVAMEDGYAQGSECVSSPAGGMGYHYVNFAAMDGEYDPTMPEALLYEMSKNGQMKLVGVEFVIVKEAWDAGNEMVPYFGMQEFDTAFDPEPLPFDNYQLHIWIWKNNPSGIFTMFNPNVSCE